MSQWVKMAVSFMPTFLFLLTLIFSYFFGGGVWTINKNGPSSSEMIIFLSRPIPNYLISYHHHHQGILQIQSLSLNYFLIIPSSRWVLENGLFMDY